MTNEVRVEGLEELRKTFLETFPKKFGGKQVQAVLTQATRPTIVAARGRVHSVSGVLKRALFSWRARGSKPGFELRNISARRGKKGQKRGLDAFYGKFVEFGRGPSVAKSGALKLRASYNFIGPERSVFRQNVKAARPKPFLGPAWQGTKTVALNLIVDGMKKQVAEGAAEAGKKR